MIPVATTVEMKAVDQAARDPVEVLIGRAGRAVALTALDLLGGAYGRRVVVVAGKGNNGADGRAAAAVLSARGVRVTVLDATMAAAGRQLPPADLIIDAAYGTGFHGTYVPPDPGHTPVLAVDIPSGLSGDTGVVGPRLGAGGSGSGAGGSAGPDSDRAGALSAVATVTFQAYKPGLLLGQGPPRCGRIVVADIGLGPGVAEIASSWLVTDWEIGWLATPSRDTHKWKSAVMVVAGSPGMMGAPGLVSRAALRAGAGYVRLGVPGAGLETLPSGEAVGVALPATGWEKSASEAAQRCQALVIGPGLGRSAAGRDSVSALLGQLDRPAVVDADAIVVLGSVEGVRRALAGRGAATVITPHDGEFERLTGRPPGEDRLAAVRDVAAASGAVVLLKGSTTIVAAPDGRAWFVTAGSPRLATAGTGDVLSGVIGAFLARGVPAAEAAALAAHVHGRAAHLGRGVGLVAGDLPDLVSDWLSVSVGGA